MVYGGGLYAFTVFVPAISAEFGWGRAVTGGLVSVFWFTAPFTLLGNYLDKRLGSFWLIVSGVIIAAMAMMALSLARTVVVMLILRALMGFAKILMACGVNVMAATWFRRQFGLAIALCYAGWHFGGLTLAPLAQFLIDHEGWRSTALIMGALIFLIGLPPLIVWARIPSPGLVIDGETGASIAYEPVVPTLMQAPAYSGEPASLARLTFWLAVAVTVLGGIAYGGLLAHEVSLISDRPVAHALGALALGLTAGFAVVGAISVGHLSDRWPYRLTMSLELGIMLISVLGFLLFLRTSSVVVLLASAITFGLSVGGFDTCIVSHLRKQVDTERFSAVYGRWYFFYLVTLFVGPILIGAVYDAFGSYQFGLYLMVACIAGAMIAVMATPFNRVAATFAAIN